MEKLVVHIGQAKTGTTTLQRCLHRNRAGLAGQGIVYPEPVFGNNHSALTVPFANSVQRGMKKHFGDEVDEARKMSSAYWRDALAQPDAGETLMLSSEFFAASPRLKDLPNFVRELSGFAGETEFVYYVRTPSERFTSYLQQHLKANHKIPRPPKLDLDYMIGLQNVATLRVRHFSRDTLLNGDIVDDFCELTGIGCGDFTDKASTANASMSAEGMILLQEYRRAYHSENKNVFTADTREYIEAIVAVEQHATGKYTRPVLRKRFAVALDADSPASVWLAEHHGVNLRKARKGGNISPRDTRSVDNVSDLIFFDAELLAELREAVETRQGDAVTPRAATG